MTINAYPLSWPAGWKRTERAFRESSKFKSTLAVARDELMLEIERLQGRYHSGGDPILSTNLELRLDGLPYANRTEPVDSGVAVYFQYQKRQMVFACDKYVKVWENMVAIRKTIEAIRGLERWGASDMMERAFNGFVALPDQSGEGWWTVLGVPATCSRAEAQAAYKRARSANHPDRGGDPAQFNRVQEAWQEYEKESP